MASLPAWSWQDKGPQDDDHWYPGKYLGKAWSAAKAAAPKVRSAAGEAYEQASEGASRVSDRTLGHVGGTLAGQIERSYRVLSALADPSNPDHQIPLAILENARGLVFLTQVKAGFLWSGAVGVGIIVARLDHRRWSAPVSVGQLGVGFGLQMGVQKTDTVIVLNTPEAVHAFSSRGQLKFGTDAALAAGPVGRNMQTEARLGERGVAASFCYSHAQGLFGGLSLEGAALAVRAQDNEEFYGPEATAAALLDGNVPPPEEAAPLHALLNQLCGSATPQAKVARASEDLRRTVGGGPVTSRPSYSYSGGGSQAAIWMPGDAPPPPPPPEGWQGTFVPSSAASSSFAGALTTVGARPPAGAAVSSAGGAEHEAAAHHGANAFSSAAAPTSAAAAAPAGAAAEAAAEPSSEVAAAQGAPAGTAENALYSEDFPEIPLSPIAEPSAPAPLPVIKQPSEIERIRQRLVAESLLDGDGDAEGGGAAAGAPAAGTVGGAAGEAAAVISTIELDDDLAPVPPTRTPAPAPGEDRGIEDDLERMMGGASGKPSLSYGANVYMDGAEQWDSELHNSRATAAEGQLESSETV